MLSDGGDEFLGREDLEVKFFLLLPWVMAERWRTLPVSSI